MGNQAALMKVLMCVLLTLPMISATTTQEYCNLCANHTMCNTTVIGPNCNGTIYNQGVPSNQINIILNEHNHYRSWVAMGNETRGNPGPQPGCSNMTTLVWDGELANVSQRWANQCTWGHDTCRNVPRFSWVGQNLFMLTWSVPCGRISQNPDWPTAIKAFYDEVNVFPNSSVAKYTFGSNYGHYSQLLWGNTKYVGCGFTVYETSAQCKLYYACNYAPGGNVIGTQMYKIGKARADCPNARYNSTYPGLC